MLLYMGTFCVSIVRNCISSPSGTGLLDNVTVLQVERFENHLYKRTRCVEDCDDYVSSRSLLSPAVRQLSSDCLSAFGFSEIIYA